MQQTRPSTRTRSANEYRVSLALMAAIGLFPLISDSIYWQGVVLVAVFYALIAAAWNLQFGYTGQISMAPAAFAMIGAYTTGVLSFHLQWSPWLGIPAAVIVAMALGAALGTVALRLRGPYLALTTLAFAEIARNVIVASHGLTRGDIGLPVVGITDSRLAWFYIFLGTLLVVQTGIFLLLRAPAGLYLQAIRDDETGAAARGVRVVFWKVTVVVLGSGLCGLAGAMYAHFAKVATPEIGVLYQAAVVIAMVVIGGSGTLIGPIFGAVFVWCLTELLRDAGGYQGLVFAALILVIARFYPRGVWGLVETLRSRSAGPPAAGSSVEAKG